ncbi:L,D-transpeptidase [Aeromicrobium sp. CFBP 8757]|uniref:L,D-transpeptidase n=1 Tax=Aeromicrobium sp. CFBP 8757 TaxID=2775288 RepID=UPI001783891C|nr:L,D-transpeptidase [Aeromicrobium sp. CFBP 8757]
MSKHRAERRPARRAALAVAALGLTAVVGAAAAVVPQLGTDAADARQAVAAPGGTTPTVTQAAPVEQAAPSTVTEPQVDVDVDAVALAVDDPAVPADSGEGRRIVFSETEQRVWLVDADETVERTYPVSGSRFDNLDPGTYRVQSKTRDATAFDASGTMEYFVRFATGFSEPIGFHSVPRDNDGVLEQTKAQLGTPLSAGCVRQWKPDAIALWEFAPVGTPVVVIP